MFSFHTQFVCMYKKGLRDQKNRVYIQGEENYIRIQGEENYGNLEGDKTMYTE